MKTFAVACVSLVLLSTANLRAEPTPVSPCKVFAVTGDFEGKEIDYVAERKGKTTVYLFVSGENFARPIARYLKTLDTEMNKGIDGAKDAKIVAVWLTNDVAQSKEYLPRAQQSLQFTQTALCVFPITPPQPEGWNIDIASHLTAVVVRDGKEIARFSYKSTNETDMPDVVKALAKK